MMVDVWCVNGLSKGGLMGRMREDWWVIVVRLGHGMAGGSVSNGRAGYHQPLLTSCRHDR